MMTQTGTNSSRRRCAGLEEAQRHAEYLIGGRRYERIPSGGACADCGAGPGKLHVAGCEEEICPRCGGLVIACDCAYGARRAC